MDRTESGADHPLYGKPWRGAAFAGSDQDLPAVNKVSDFMDMLKVFDRDSLTEFQYIADGDDWEVVLK